MDKNSKVFSTKLIVLIAYLTFLLIMIILSFTDTLNLTDILKIFLYIIVGILTTILFFSHEIIDKFKMKSNDKLSKLKIFYKVLIHYTIVIITIYLSYIYVKNPSFITRYILIFYCTITLFLLFYSKNITKKLEKLKKH